MRKPKAEKTTNELVKASLALIVARVLRDHLSSMGRHAADLDQAIKDEEGEPAPAEEIDEHDED